MAEAKKGEGGEGDQGDEPNELVHLKYASKLVGINEPSHTVLNLEDVVVYSVDIITDVVFCTDNSGRVEAAKVDGAGGL